ncbi:homoserine dehydrogenase [Granulicella tundricola]|uniref:Homoserine dehydrogenase n=1 Tax=Granulicella tundricola (strain ATCC BAA-1859 / DSM 23138 / MP5ACTX9) TaxID=1198114 RepID=E8WYX5_GRATM|nr:homoserine dehydrogenase [Granulicella tundricola]ADW69890.1 homoserine dehydrogenase [Granulicella tundricola MP5ACTX9]
MTTQNITKIALVGFGTVGSSVAKLLHTLNLPNLRLTHIYNRGIAGKRGSAEAAFVPADAIWTEDIEDLLTSDADVIVELMGGLDPAGPWIERALASGKSVVTANKQLIAYQGPALLAKAAATNVHLLHGAAVAGGVPVIPGITQGLGGDQITRISGILNGTCNFILSKMEAGARYSEVLAEAQSLGYAESDPTADVGGFDARAKLCILARIGMHVELDPEQVATQTIALVDAVDFAYAKELGCTIRQVSRVQLSSTSPDSMYARVAPMLVPRESPIAWSHGTQNMVVTTGRFGGDVVFSGHGAGGEATAVAVLSDLLAVSQNSRPVAFPVTPRPVTGDSVAPHYLRFIVDDKPGIVSAIAGALSKVGANIDSIIQRPGYPKNRLAFVVTTEPCLTSTIAEAVESMGKMDCMLEPPLSLQILVIDDKDEPTA